MLRVTFGLTLVPFNLVLLSPSLSFTSFLLSCHPREVPVLTYKAANL